MTKMRLTAFSIIISSLVVLASSCRRDDVEHENTYSKDNLVMSGAQETPANSSSATGSLNVSYSRLSRTLTYQFSWQNLSDTITGIHIHGLAPAGFPASIFQNILTTKNEKQFPYSKGSGSGSLFIDGVAIKEADLLNGLYYLNIHTKTYTGGEIRGQIVFQ